MTDIEQTLELLERLAQRVAHLGQALEDKVLIQDIMSLRARLKREAEMSGR